jgi:hypothetical protein
MKSVLFCYPWDFEDEGIDTLVGRIRDLGVTHVAVAASYHAGYFLYPHGRRRKTHLLEDGVVYFHPSEASYTDGPIRPTVAAMSRERDWIGDICQSAAAAGLGTIAWTVLLHNTPIGLRHPEATVHNVFGDSYPHALSPAHPASVALARGLVGDLSAHYPLDAILLEAPNYRNRAHGGSWVAGHHHERCGVHLRPLEMRLLDLSFNEADVEQATDAGIDLEGLRGRVADHLTRYFEAAPDMPADLPETVAQFRERHPTFVDMEDHYKRMEQALLAALQEEARPHGTRLIGGGDPAIDIVMTGAYGESVEGTARITSEAAAHLEGDQELMVTLRLGFDGPGMGEAIISESKMVEATGAVAANGAHLIGFYNYAEAPIRCVEWIRPALAAVDGEG